MSTSSSRFIETTLPDFKDQVRSVITAIPSQDNAETLTIIGRPEQAPHNIGDSNNENNSPKIMAVVASQHDAILVDGQNVTRVEEAPTTLKGDKKQSSDNSVPIHFKRRKLFILCALILGIILAIVLGVCLSGTCQHDDDSKTKQDDFENNENVTISTLSPTYLRYPTHPPTQNKDIIRSALIASFIGNISFHEFDYPDCLVIPKSTEDKALKWIIEKDPLHLSVSSEVSDANLQIRQRYALATLWFIQSDSMDAWNTNSDWLTLYHECQWSGVSCQERKILKIDLPNNNLRGQIPSDLALLSSSLTSLDFDSNELIGSLPASLGHLTRLEFFAADDNKLEGTIPSSLGSWTQVREVWLHRNDLSGTLPESFSEWERIVKFSVGDNTLNGTLPASYGNWSLLQEVRFNNNQFKGTLPDLYGEWKSIKRFSVSNNELNGTIPLSYRNWTNLRDAWLFNNNLSGEVPFCGVFIKNLIVDCSKVTCDCCTDCCPESTIIDCMR